MNCRSARQLLMPWLDSELDARALCELDGHLRDCGPCRERFAAEARVESALCSTLREPPTSAQAAADECVSDACWDRWVAELPSGAALPRRTGRVFAAAAVVLVLGAAGAWYAWLRPQPVALIAELRARFDADVAGTARPELLATQADSLQAFFGTHGLSAYRVPEPGVHGGHPLGLVGASSLSIGDARGVELLMNCCGHPATVYVLPRSACELLCAQAAAEVAAGGAAHVTVDGVTTTMFLDHDLLVSVVSEHEVPLDAWRAG